MWFSAALLFRGCHTASPEMDTDEQVWEESILLVKADTLSEAERKAHTIGERTKVAYRVSNGDTLTWKFVKVSRVFEIESNKLETGVELFSRFLKTRDVESLAEGFGD